MAASMHLQNFRGILRFFTNSRAFSTSDALRDNLKNSRMMQKFLQKKQRKKSHHWTTPFVREPVFAPLGSGGKKKGFSEGMERRASHVNRIFYETVSQIIANGELDIYVDITKVKVVPDFSNVAVYWEGKGTEEDDETERILQDRAGFLRSLMMRSNTLGRVPAVTFVKDLTYARMKEVEHLLRIAELPPPEEKLATDVETELSSSDNEKLADEINFRQDLYGLNHDALMQKITSMKNSSRHRQQQPVELHSTVNTEAFSEDVKKFDKSIAGKSRTENMKKYSELFRQQKTKGRPRYDVDDLLSTHEETAVANDIEIKYEYTSRLDNDFEDDHSETDERINQHGDNETDLLRADDKHK